jgi:chorismate mutase/prephenate dehydratase
MRISFLGPEGTFCHLAVLRRFGESIHPLPKSTINEVFKEVERGRAHLGVVPMENSIEGSVDLTLDLLARTSLYIVGEISIEVSHALISKEKAVESIEHVFSHPLAIAQCREWLAKNLPHCRLHESPSTAQAVSMAKENPSSAAIASSNAARMNALRVLAEDIQDSPSNLTRFAILGKEICRRTGKDKTSLLFMVPHRPGALFYALRPFAEASINLCRIESRPTRMKNWEYLFFLDLEGHVDDGHVRDAVSEFERQATWVKLLGSYPRDPHTLP